MLSDEFYEYAEKESQRVYALKKHLESQGHTCCLLLESYPKKLSWCGLTVCQSPEIKNEEKKINKIDESIKNFINKLNSEKHYCVKKLDNFPYIEWCNNKICNIKKTEEEKEEEKE